MARETPTCWAACATCLRLLYPLVNKYVTSSNGASLPEESLSLGFPMKRKPTTDYGDTYHVVVRCEKKWAREEHEGRCEADWKYCAENQFNVAHHSRLPECPGVLWSVHLSSGFSSRAIGQSARLVVRLAGLEAGLPFASFAEQLNHPRRTPRLGWLPVSGFGRKCVDLVVGGHFSRQGTD